MLFVLLPSLPSVIILASLFSIPFSHSLTDSCVVCCSLFPMVAQNKSMLAVSCLLPLDMYLAKEPPLLFWMHWGCYLNLVLQRGDFGICPTRLIFFQLWGWGEGRSLVRITKSSSF